jgi:hypothetical protein
MDAKTLLTNLEVMFGLEHPGLTTLYGGKLKWEGKPLTATSGWGINVKAVECFPIEGPDGKVMEQVRVVGHVFGVEDEEHKVVLLPITRGKSFNNLDDYGRGQHNPQVILGKEDLTELLDQKFDGIDLKATFIDPQVYTGPGKQSE